MAAPIILKLACVILVCMAVTAPYASAIACGSVIVSLTPCLEYLRTGGAVPPACCAGVKALNNLAKTTPDRQTACECMKTTASRISGIDLRLAGSLPAKCGMSIPFKFSPSMDCKKYASLSQLILLNTSF